MRRGPGGADLKNFGGWHPYYSCVPRMDFEGKRSFAVQGEKRGFEAFNREFETAYLEGGSSFGGLDRTSR